MRSPSTAPLSRRPPTRRRPWLRWGFDDVGPGPRQSRPTGHGRRDARPAGRDLRSIGRASARVERSGHGAQQPRALRRAARSPLSLAVAVRARSRSTADAAADLRHEPAPQRPADRRQRELRPAAHDRRAAGAPARCWSESSRPKSPLCDDDDGRDDGARAASSAAKRCGSPTATSIRGQTLATVTRADFLSGRRHRRSRGALRPPAAGRETRASARPDGTARPGSSSWRWASSAASS